MTGELIREKRKQRGLTLNELSSLSGISPSQISKIERGDSELTNDTFLKLLKAMRLPEEEVHDIVNKHVLEYYILLNFYSESVKEARASYVAEKETRDDFKKVTSDWIFASEPTLTYSEVETLSSELEDFYNVRLRRLKLNKEE
ncbi:helix-turn-helix domain-containing protein [Paenibacillus pinihumi]|uniref:helix-turn-helix domain-containing protein n=1 Tax=Paenibacillus pinihumi TaxID=669462 RepID=UPI0003FEDD1B|nr:helix-turn-helix transcriptional regulator [Paenibacillus pinihumi]